MGVDLDSVLVFVEENKRWREEGSERNKSQVRRIECDPLSICLPKEKQRREC